MTKDQVQEIKDDLRDIISFNFTRAVPLEFRTHRYTIKTAESPHEYLGAFRLRRLCFFKKTGIDFDSFDIDSDHLIAIDNTTGEVVGNYRVRCSKFHKNFYSETEFELTEFLTTPETKTEIGRACVHPSFRNGQVVLLLWSGILEYIKLTSSKTLFGCSSVPAKAPMIEFIWQEIQKRKLINHEFFTFPRRPFPIGLVSPEDSAIPSLFDSYLRSGAQVIAPPAYDPDFHCADFLTVLDIKNIPESRKSFFIERLRK